MAKSTTTQAGDVQRPAHTPSDLLDALDGLQARVRELEEALERQERLATVGTIAGLIAHEFNNILTPVLSYAQMAQANPDDRELVAKALKRAADGADRAGQIASAILGLVRRENSPGHAVLECTLGDALDRALACLARPLANDGIELQIEIDRDAPIHARPVAVEHVLLNLIINARNAMASRGGVLRIRSARNLPDLSPEAARSWSGGDEWPKLIHARSVVVVMIDDSGPGIHPGRLTTLLNPNAAHSQSKHNTNISSSFERRGHGLGMLVCKRLIEDAGGALAVESEVGRGTRVWVVWPAGGTGRRGSAPQRTND